MNESEIRLEERIRAQGEETHRLSILYNDISRSCAIIEQRLRMSDEKVDAFSDTKEKIDRFLHTYEYQNKIFESLSRKIESLEKSKYLFLGGAAVISFLATFATSIMSKLL